MNQHNYNHFLVLDYETSCLEWDLGVAMEIGAVLIDGSSLIKLGEFQSLIAPYRPNPKYDKRALEVHGISIQETLQAPTLHDTYTKLFAWVNSFMKSRRPKHKTIIAGHNVVFDLSYWLDHYFINKIKFEDLFQTSQVYGRTHFKYMDTMDIALAQWNDNASVTSHKLTDCIDRMGIQLNDAHRALNDCHATADYFIEIVRRIRSQSNNLSTEQKSHRDGFKFEI